MLAYVFWHRPAPAVEPEEYEQAQRRFHAEIGVPSACFGLAELPFKPGGDGGGYEDWYLVEDWAALGELNEAAVDGQRRPSHDRAAGLVGRGWAGVYRLLRGAPRPPEEARWLEKPVGVPVPDLVGGASAEAAVWQRQMVLGPAPELCVGEPGPVTRRRVC